MFASSFLWLPHVESNDYFYEMRKLGVKARTNYDLLQRYDVFGKLINRTLYHLQIKILYYTDCLRLIRYYENFPCIVYFSHSFDYLLKFFYCIPTRSDYLTR